MVSKLTIERTGAAGGEGLTNDARAILDSYIADGRITSIENSVVDEVEHISMFFQDAATLDSYLAELNALGEFRLPGVVATNIQRFDDI